MEKEPGEVGASPHARPAQAEVCRAEPATWRNETLAQYLAPSEIGALLEAVDAAPEKVAGKPARKGVDLDDFLWLVLEHHSRAVVKQEAWLARAFHKFDENKPGLQEVEFALLCHWAMGHVAFRMSPSDVHNPGRKRVIQRRFNVGSSKQRPRDKHPRFEFAPRDDRSSKNEPKRLETDRDTRF